MPRSHIDDGRRDKERTQLTWTAGYQAVMVLLNKLKSQNCKALSYNPTPEALSFTAGWFTTHSLTSENYNTLPIQDYLPKSIDQLFKIHTQHFFNYQQELAYPILLKKENYEQNIKKLLSIEKIKIFQKNRIFSFFLLRACIFADPKQFWERFFITYQIYSGEIYAYFTVTVTFFVIPLLLT